MTTARKDPSADTHLGSTATGESVKVVSPQPIRAVRVEPSGPIELRFGVFTPGDAAFIKGGGSYKVRKVIPKVVDVGDHMKCSEEFAFSVDAALLRLADGKFRGPASLPNFIGLRKSLIANGVLHAIATPSDRWSAHFPFALYEALPNGSWKEIVVANSSTLLSLAALAIYPGLTDNEIPGRATYALRRAAGLPRMGSFDNTPDITSSVDLVVEGLLPERLLSSMGVLIHKVADPETAAAAA